MQHSSANRNTHTEALAHFASSLKKPHKKNMLVIGDVMMDVFMRSTIERISPEAPVPIVHEGVRTVHLGGAANTASNIAGLGLKTTIIGRVGRDAEGRELGKIAREAKLRPIFITDERIPTITKTRIVSQGKHIVRIDREVVTPMSKKTEAEVLRAIRNVEAPDWVVVSDYAKGLITSEVMRVLMRRFTPARIIVDPKPSNASLYHGVGVLKLNVAEAAGICGIEALNDELATKTAKKLLTQFGSAIVLTRGGEGITVLTPGMKSPVHIPAIQTEVRDVTGAGDTIAAVISFLLSHDAPLTHAAHAANLAGSIVVSRQGTTSLTAKELITELQSALS